MANDILKAYQKLREAGNRDSRYDDQYLVKLAQSEGWRTLKEAILEPKIASLLLMADDVTAAMRGDESVEAFGHKALTARIAAGHLQDVIDKVEETLEVAKEAEEAKKQAKGE